jgi:hypothetical protein
MQKIDTNNIDELQRLINMMMELATYFRYDISSMTAPEIATDMLVAEAFEGVCVGPEITISTLVPLIVNWQKQNV